MSVKEREMGEMKDQLASQETEIKLLQDTINMQVVEIIKIREARDCSLTELEALKKNMPGKAILKQIRSEF